MRDIGLEHIPTHIEYIINDTITYEPIHLSIEFLESYYSGNIPPKYMGEYFPKVQDIKESSNEN